VVQTVGVTSQHHIKQGCSVSTDHSTLSQTLLKELFDYDPETGILTNRIMRGKKAMPGANAGADTGNGYLSVKLFSITYKVHRIAWAYFHGEWPSTGIDHINGNGTDNRISNLRLATQAENNQNFTQLRQGKTSQFQGVYWAKPYGNKRGRWRAIIGVNGKKVNLGSFQFESEAVEAYERAKRELHTFNPETPRAYLK
jgi:hypothetical protein